MTSYINRFIGSMNPSLDKFKPKLSEAANRLNLARKSISQKIPYTKDKGYDDHALLFDDFLFDHDIKISQSYEEYFKVEEKIVWGKAVLASVVNLIKGNKPSSVTCCWEDASIIVPAEIALLKYLRWPAKFMSEQYAKSKRVNFFVYFDPTNNHGVYFDDIMIEHAFEAIKAKDPAKECRVKSNIEEQKVVFEYLSTDSLREAYRQRCRLESSWMPENVIELPTVCPDTRSLYQRACRGKIAAVCVARALKGYTDVAFNLKDIEEKYSPTEIYQIKSAILALLDYFNWHTCMPEDYKLVKCDYIRRYTVPFNTYVAAEADQFTNNTPAKDILESLTVYLDDDIIEWAFEYVKTEDPSKDFRIHSDIVHNKVTIEYLSSCAGNMQEAAATCEADDVEIVYANQEDAGTGEANSIETRRKNWKEMRNKL